MADMLREIDYCMDDLFFQTCIRLNIQGSIETDIWKPVKRLTSEYKRRLVLRYPRGTLTLFCKWSGFPYDAVPLHIFTEIFQNSLF